MHTAKAREWLLRPVRCRGRLQSAFEATCLAWHCHVRPPVFPPRFGPLPLNEHVLFKGGSGGPRALPLAFHAKQPIPSWQVPPGYGRPANWAGDEESWRRKAKRSASRSSDGCEAGAGYDPWW